MTAETVVRDTEVVPRRPPRDDDGPDEWAAWRVAYEREKRGWSLGELARRVTEAGAPMQHQAIWQIENRKPPRRISLSEGVAFCKVFGIELTEFGIPPEEIAAGLVREIRGVRQEWEARGQELVDLLRDVLLQSNADPTAYEPVLGELRSQIEDVEEAAEAIKQLFAAMAEIRPVPDPDRRYRA